MSSRPNRTETRKAVDQPGHHIAPLIVRAQPMRAHRRRGGRDRQVEVDGAIGIGHQRPDHPTALVDQVLDERVGVVGVGLELAAERGLGIVREHRRVIGAVIAHQKRPVVGDELGEQAEREQAEEYPERPEAAPVGTEVREPAAGQRGHPDTQHAPGVPGLGGGRHLTPLSIRSRSGDRPGCR